MDYPIDDVYTEKWDSYNIGDIAKGNPTINIINKKTGSKISDADKICDDLDYKTFKKTYVIRKLLYIPYKGGIEIEETKKAFEKMRHNIALPEYINPNSGDFFITISTLTYRTGVAEENDYSYTQLIFYQWDEDIIDKLEAKVKWPRKDKESEKEMLCTEWDGIMR